MLYSSAANPEISVSGEENAPEIADNKASSASARAAEKEMEIACSSFCRC